MGLFSVLPNAEEIGMKPIPGTVAAFTILAFTSLIMLGSVAGGFWLLAEGAAMVGHALPQPLL
jgi:hypothetical protein